MEIRKTGIDDLKKVMEIYDSARVFMRENGNPTQWANRYPDEDTILADISKGQSYVCVEGDEILGVFCFFLGHEPTYDKIYNGEWLSTKESGVIHRIASGIRGRGVASFCFKYCEGFCENLRIDTHRDNIPMQKALEKNGFSYCGIIYLKNGDERLAFQKCL